MKQRTETPGADSERGARVLRLAVALMSAGQARGWSHAIEQARKLIK